MCWYNNFGADIFAQHDDDDDEEIEVKFLEMLVTDIIIWYNNVLTGGGKKTKLFLQVLNYPKQLSKNSEKIKLSSMYCSQPSTADRPTDYDSDDEQSARSKLGNSRRLGSLSFGVVPSS